MTTSKPAYETHLKPGQIRLLQLVDWHFEDENHVHFVATQRIVNLDAKPEYSAISYTWGYPYGNQAQQGEASKPLSARMNLDGLDISISPNLCRALTSFAHEAKTGWIWIDALCIRQNDMTERNHQVQMMRTIFSSANVVLIFLGHEWSCAYGTLADVAEIIESFVPALAVALKEKRLLVNNLYIHSPKDPDFEEMLDIEEFYRKLLTFGQFCNVCWWFCRVWCFQEVILARDTVLHCGSYTNGHRLSWDQLSVLIQTVQKWRWGYELVELEMKDATSQSDDRRNGYMSLNMMVHTRVLIRDLFGEQLALESDRSANDARIQRLAEEEGLVLSGVDPRRHLRLSPSLNLVKRTATTRDYQNVFTAILHSSRHAVCADDRDRVYGMLGILDLFWTEDISLRIPVDYAKSVKDVYKDILVLTLEMSQDLGLIACQGSKNPAVRNWPSWLPDLRIARFQRTGSSTLDELNATTGLSKFADHSLRGKLPFHVGDSEIKAFGGTFDVVCQVVETSSARRGIPLLQDLQDCLPRYICGRRRFEVIWRTLTEDLQDREHGIQDLDPFEKAYLSFIAISFVQSFNLEEIDAARYLELTEGFSRVLRAFETESEELRETTIEFVAANLGLTGDDYDHVSETQQGRWTGFGVSTIIFLKIVIKDRNLFVTRQGFLGSCPPDTKIGDEVWVLDGSRVPLVLRPTADEGSYTMVGDTFMLDLMNGEMLHEEHGLCDRLRCIDIV